MSKLWHRTFDPYYEDKLRAAQERAAELVKARQVPLTSKHDTPIGRSLAAHKGQQSKKKKSVSLAPIKF